ncbi:trigger factor [Micromonospora chersina]|uniref:trigger factor n=1 Tax=Micromonospora chersina TaxID=47854 RepID=UPI0037B8A033
MKTSVDGLADTRVRITIEVPSEELEPDLKVACSESESPAEAGANASIAGFRRGKLPFRAIDQRDAVVVLSHGVQGAILSLVSAAAREHGLLPLSRPDVEIVSCGGDDPLIFTALIDVRQKIVLPDLSSLVVAVDPVTVSELEVDQCIDELRQQFAVVQDVDRPVALGDTVHVVVYASVEGAEIQASRASGILFDVGSNQVIDAPDSSIVDTLHLVSGLDTLLVGLSVGESVRVSTKLLSGAFMGREADVTFTVASVRYRQLPEFNEQFASFAGDFGSPEQLREHMRQRLVRFKYIDWLRVVRTRALASLAEASGVQPPQGVLQDEVEHRKQWMLNGLKEVGTSLAEYLSLEGKTEERLYDELREAAEHRICGQLVLDALVEAAGLQASHAEVSEVVTHRARRVGVDPQSYYRQLVEAGGAESIRVDLLRAKGLGLIMQRLTVTDNDGNRLALSLMDVL